jgi:hypothetical protein
LKATISSTERVETDAWFEIVRDGIFILGLGFAFGSMGGDGGVVVVVVVYSGMSCEFV